MPVTVEKIESPADDVSLNATKLAYTAESGLSPTVQSVGVDVYLSSTDLKIAVKGDKAATNVQKALKEHGLDARVTSSTNAEARILTVRNSDASTGMITLATALGKLGDAPGGISREAADQIVEMELAAARIKPSELQLVNISTQQARSRFADRIRPTSYVKADIHYELSPVAYVEEDSQPSANGSERFTRMGLRNSAASTLVLKALGQSGINADIQHIDGTGLTHVIVHAPADKISKTLRGKGLLLASIDTEIQDTAFKARLEATEEQARLQQAIAKTANQL